MASEIKVDTISEKTSANGVTIDGLNVKDSALVTAGSVPLSTIDIDGGTDIGAAIVDADLFIIDDGAGGTNRKVTASRIKTYAGVSGDVTTIDSLLNTDIKIGEDDQTKIDFETANTIHFYADNENQIKLTDGVLAPVTDSNIDLGTSSLYFKDTFLDTIRTTGVSVFGSPTSASSGGYTGKVQVSEAGANPSMTLNGNVANDGGVALVLSKSRNATVGTNTIVADNDVVGSIFWAADDGTNMDCQPASIVCKIDGTPGENDTPGELIFGTTADGAANPTTRMTISPTGLVSLASGQIDFPDSANVSTDANVLDDYQEGDMNLSSSQASNFFTGFFTKIGRMVFFTCAGTVPTSSNSATQTLTGLPFTVKDQNGPTDGGDAGAGYISYESNNGKTASFVLRNNATTANFYQNDNNVATHATYSGDEFILGGMYTTDQ